MYYFYYFQCYQTKLYYGGITNNVLKRQKEHQKDLNKNLKSAHKPWHLYQNKIQLIILWGFETKSQACVYEPIRRGYKIHQGNLSWCLSGKLRTVNGYYVALCL